MEVEVAPGPPEIQALDLPRNLVAYRAFSTGEGTCSYPGLADPASGVTLGFASLSNNSREEWVIYDAPAPGVPCTTAAVAAGRLAAAKARSQELGLERVSGGLPGCQALVWDVPVTVEVKGTAHTLVYQAHGTDWDGKQLGDGYDVSTSHGGRVCVDRGWVFLSAQKPEWRAGLPFDAERPPLYE